MASGGFRKNAGLPRQPSPFHDDALDNVGKRKRGGDRKSEKANSPADLHSRGLEAGKFSALGKQARDIAQRSMAKLEEALDSGEKIPPQQLAQIAERATNILVKLQVAEESASTRDRSAATGDDIAKKAELLKAAAAELLSRDQTVTIETRVVEDAEEIDE